MKIRYRTSHLITVTHKGMTNRNVLTTINHRTAFIDFIHNDRIPCSTVRFGTFFVGHSRVITEERNECRRYTHFKSAGTGHTEIRLNRNRAMGHQGRHGRSLSLRIPGTIIISPHIIPVILCVEVRIVKRAIPSHRMVMILHNCSHSRSYTPDKTTVRYLGIKGSFLTP